MRSAPLSVILLFLFSHCAARDVGIAQLQQTFSRAEYLANGDGWAEARRRSLLKDYLRAAAMPFHEMQQAKPGAPNDKYKQVTIVVPGSSESTDGDFSVTLALVPDQADQWRKSGFIRQQQCDAVLFSALERLTLLRRRHKRILLTMDSGCHAERLTARLEGAK